MAWTTYKRFHQEPGDKDQSLNTESESGQPLKQEGSVCAAEDPPSSPIMPLDSIFHVAMVTSHKTEGGSEEDGDFSYINTHVVTYH